MKALSSLFLGFFSCAGAQQVGSPLYMHEAIIVKAAADFSCDRQKVRDEILANEPGCVGEIYTCASQVQMRGCQKKAVYSRVGNAWQLLGSIVVDEYASDDIEP